MCYLSEFLSFQLVSRQWRELSENEHLLLIAVYSGKKLGLDSLFTDVPTTARHEIATGLDKAGYLRQTDEPGGVELTLVGEAEVQHRFFNLGAGDSLPGTTGGNRVQHHSVQNYEVQLARSSTLSVNVEGMLIRIFTLPNSGTVIRIDHDIHITSP